MSWGNYEFIETNLDDRVLTLALNRPDAGNATNKVLHGELSRVFIEAAADIDVDIIVLTANGKLFSGGGDIEYLDFMIKHPEEFDRTIVEGRQIIYSMLDCEKPIIGKINGHAAGLGATLVVMCDVTFVADHARISDPHVKVGLTAGDGAAIMWPMLVGYARSKEYLMTGKPIRAKDAEAIGLINHAVPLDELDERVDAFVRELADGAQMAIRSTKMTINIGLKQLAHAAMEMGSAMERLTNRSPDHRSAIDAMLRKEAPVFKKK
ncbi:MAG: enoyl-CoA hydratase/isomerase family protein [Sphingomonadaceae bacterium]|nr:enoyl-CoA hydratase/isomerase family protein [Sphingomonadaceae bacterium]